MLNVILLPNDRQSIEQLARILSEKGTDLGNEKIQELLRQVEPNRRQRLVVKKGIEFISVKLEDVALFFTENKLVFLVDKTGKKYMTEKNLTDLETELDPSLFFRANRQYILNVNFIRGFKPYEKVKLLVDLVLTDSPYHVVVSQETAPEFRKWIFNA